MVPHLCPLPPVLAFRHSDATDKSATPQQALTAGLWTDLCRPVVERSITTTWIVVGTGFGLAHLHAECPSDLPDHRPWTAILTLYDEATNSSTAGAGATPTGTPLTITHRWTMHIGSIFRQTPADLPVGVEASIPSWLPLPPGRYASTLEQTSER
jgi:hypothetical protein